MLTTPQIDIINAINPLQLTMSMIVQRCQAQGVKPPTRVEVTEGVISGVFAPTHLKEFLTWLQPGELAAAQQIVTGRKTIELLQQMQVTTIALGAALGDLTHILEELPAAVAAALRRELQAGATPAPPSAPTAPTAVQAPAGKAAKG